MRRFVLVGGWLALLWAAALPATQAQSDPRVRITAANADRLGEMARAWRGTVTALAWAPDGVIVVGVPDGLWWYAPAGDGNYAGEFMALSGEWVQALAFAPDGATLAVAQADGVVTLLDTGRRAPVGTLSAGQSVWRLAFDPAGERLALGVQALFARDANSVQLWDVRQPTTPALTVSLDTGQQTVWGIAFGPAGDTLVAALRERVRIWHQDPAGVWVLTADLPGDAADTFTDLALSPDGQTLVASSTGGVRRWSLPGGEPLESLWNGAGRAWHVAFSADGTQLAAVIDDQVRVLDASGAEHGVSGNNLVFGADGGLLIAGPDGELSLWSTNGQSVGALPDHSSPIVGLGFSPAGVLIAARQRSLWRWPPAHELEPARAELFSAGVRAFAVDETGRWAVATRDGALYVWSPDNSQPLQRLAPGGAAPVESLALSAASDWLAVGHDDGIVVLWDVAQRTIRATLARHGWRVHDLAFSPDGALLASSGLDEMLVLWDVATGAALATGNLVDGAYGVAFSQDGARLAVGVNDGIMVLSVDRLPFEDLFSAAEQFLPVTGAAHALAFSPDDTLLAALDTVGTLRLFDAVSGAELFAAAAEAQEGALAFSADGTLMATGGVDGIVRLWGVPAGQ